MDNGKIGWKQLIDCRLNQAVAQQNLSVKVRISAVKFTE
jgi:hypothetical protein